MSDESPTAKKNRKEQKDVLKMINNSHKIHQASVNYQISVKNQRENNYKNGKHNEFKKVNK